MTTTSSIAFPSMEVPVADDSMEMASPLPGHDDFEIDLDVMEDQASNADKDMMGAEDDYPTGDEIDVDYQRDANDADMIDDVAEPTMVDADDQYPNDNEMQYATEEPYEAEMEDEYAEDSDVPMPKVNEDDPAAEQDDGEKTPKAEGAAEPVQEVAQTNGVVDQIQETESSSLEPAATAAAVESKSEDVAQAVEEPQINLEEHRPESEKVAEEATLDQQKSEQTEQTEKTEHEIPSAVQKGQESGESHVPQPDASEADQKAVKQTEEHGETAETQTSVDQPEVQVSGSSEEKEDHVTENQEPRTGLHPVKVYYQDNEISLFPPREGDASETYFLGDESLAYEPFGKLFESFRSILRDHISDNDILVIDIDSMNIQLTEDSMHLSQVTLHQIVNLYLHLCDNESIGEPETLYLSLSTKLTIPALLSDIQAAANDGKGLSEIFWDDYDEAAQTDDHAEGHQPDDKTEQDVSAKLPEPQVQEPKEPEEPEEHHVHEEREHEHEHDHEPNHEAPASSSVEAPQAEQQKAPEERKEPEVGENHQEEEQEEPEAPAAAEEDVDRYEDSHSHEHDETQQEQAKEVNFDTSEQNVSYEQEGEAPPGEDGGEDMAPAGENEDGGEEFEEGEEEYVDEFQQYDEPEQQEQEQGHSGVEQSFEPEEQKTESTATLTPLPAQDAPDNQPEAEESANVTQAEETNPDAPEENENVDDGLEIHATDDVDADADADAYANVFEGEEEEKAEAEEEPQEPGLADEDAQENEENDEEEGSASHEDAEDAAAGEASKEDLNGILHEQNESTTAEAGVLDVAEEYDQETTEKPDEEGNSNVNNNVDNGNNDNEDNLDEFLDIDFDAEFGTMDSEAVASEQVSTKRSREPEDETDPTGTSTPDVKRTRSS